MPSDHRSREELRHDIELERRELARAVGQLREGLGEATDLAGRIRRNLPLAVGSALGAGFLLAGGLGATMRLVTRRGRGGPERARLGRRTLVDHR